jgi:hypothetical protein
MSIVYSLFLRLPQPGGPDFCIYIPQEQDIPVIPLDIGLECTVTLHFYFIPIFGYMILHNVSIPATNCKRAHEYIHNPMYMMKR